MEEEIKKDDVQVNKEISKEELKPTNKKKIIFNFILILTIFLGLLIYMIQVDGIDNIINLLYQVDYRWVLAGVVCLLIHWACEAINLHIPLKKMYPNQNIKNSIKVSMIGLLFNNITPFASGGQPMQAYELTKTGKRVSDSLSAMAIKFIITQIALVVTTIVVIFFEFDFFKNLMQNYLWVAIVGFLINILAIVIVILVGIKKSIISSITTPIIKFLGKIHILKQEFHTFIIIFSASSFLIAIILPLTKKALGSLEGLTNTGIIFVPPTSPISNNLLFIPSSQFIFFIFPLLFNGN